MSIQGIFRAPKLNPSKFGTFRLPEFRRCVFWVGWFGPKHPRLRSGEAERFFATENMGAFLQMSKGKGVMVIDW